MCGEALTMLRIYTTVLKWEISFLSELQRDFLSFLATYGFPVDVE